MVVISSAGRFDRKLAGVGDAGSASIIFGWRNLSAKETRGASINSHTSCNANPSFLKLSFDFLGNASEGADRPTNNNLNVEMIMKHMMHWMIGTVTLCAAATLALGAEDTLPGQVDFGAFSAPKGDGEFVEVNVPTGLITLAARLVEKEQPDVAKLLNSIKLVRVNVIGMDAENRDALQKRAQKVREDLAGKGWDRIVTAQEKDQDVSVYLKMTDKGAVQGLAAVMIEGKEHAVFANVVGDIKPEQLAMLGDKLHIDPLKQIGNAAQKPESKAKEKAEE